MSDRKNLDDATTMRDKVTDPAAIKALNQFINQNKFPTSMEPGAQAVRNWLNGRPSKLDGLTA